MINPINLLSYYTHRGPVRGVVGDVDPPQPGLRPVPEAVCGGEEVPGVEEGPRTVVDS